MGCPPFSASSTSARCLRSDRIGPFPARGTRTHPEVQRSGCTSRTSSHDTSWLTYSRRTPLRAVLHLRALLLSHRAEAIATIHGPVTPRPERHHGIYAALGANRGMHLSRSSGSAVLVPASAATLGTAPRLLGVSPGSEELLLPDGEGKGR